MNLKSPLLALMFAALLAPTAVSAGFTCIECIFIKPPPPPPPPPPTPSDESIDESKIVINRSSELLIAPKFPDKQKQSGALIEFVIPVFVDKSKSCS